VVPRVGAAGDLRLPGGDERGGGRVGVATRRAQAGRAHRGVPRVLGPHDSPRARTIELSRPLDPSAVRDADPVPQGDRLAPFHRLVGGSTGAPGPAEAVRIARDGGRGAVRVLVTGATGFTGGPLARALAAAGDSVSALVRARGPATAGLEAA